MTYQTVNPGLEKVIVADTRISDVRGEEGQLIYRGYGIETLVTWPFARVAWLLLFDEVPNEEQETLLQSFLVSQGQLSAEELETLTHLPKRLHPMLMLQAMVPTLQADPAREADFPDTHPELRRGMVIAAKIPTLIANWYHWQEQGESVPYPHHPNVHENFLTQWQQAVPDGQQVSVLDATQILQMEHGFNASAFSARVTASTEAPIESVISAAIGTLYGRLHGGADQAALEMALEIGHPDAARDYVLNRLNNKEKIMGMGHREYRTLDPRAKVLKPMARELCEAMGKGEVYHTLAAVEQSCQEYFAEKQKEIWANVEFYKGAVFMALGIPPRFFTSLFAMARVFGYLAHFSEFKQNSRVIRPHARYVGR